MKNIIQFHIFKSDGYYVAEGVGVSVVTQGKTMGEVINNMEEAIDLHFTE